MPFFELSLVIPMQSISNCTQLSLLHNHVCYRITNGTLIIVPLFFVQYIPFYFVMHPLVLNTETAHCKPIHCIGIWWLLYVKYFFLIFLNFFTIFFLCLYFDCCHIGVPSRSRILPRIIQTSSQRPSRALTPVSIPAWG